MTLSKKRMTHLIKIPLVVGWLLLLLYGSAPIGAQNLSKISYALNSPLKTSTIYDLYFSSEELLYIATDNGLWSYDGLEFFQYQHSIEFSSRLNNIQETAQQKIMVCDFNGNIFSIKKDSLVQETLPIKEKIKNFIVQEKQTYYIGEHTIYWQEHTTKKILPLHLPSDLEDVLYCSKKGVFYTRSTGGERYVATVKDSSITLSTLNGNSVIFYNELDSDLYAFDTSRTHLMDEQGDTLVSLEGKAKGLSLFRLKKINGQVFMACREGLYLPESDQLFFKGHFITNIVEDNEQNLWISTINKGLLKIPSLKNGHYPVANAATEVDLVFIHQDKLIYSDKLGKLYAWNKVQQVFELLDEFIMKGQLKNIFFDTSTKEYVFSGNEIHVLDAHLNFVQRSTGYGELGLIDAHHFYMYRRQMLTFGSWNGVANLKIKFEDQPRYKTAQYTWYKSIDKQVDRIKMMPNKSTKGIKIFGNKVVSTFNDSLLFISQEDYQIKYAVRLPAIQSLHVGNNRLFVITKKQLIEFDSLGRQLGRIERGNKLKSRIYNLHISANYLVITTKYGVYTYAAQGYTPIHQYTPQNGIVSLDFTKAWVYDEILYVNGSTGISKIPLAQVQPTGKAQVALQKVLVNQQENSSSKLAYNENNLELFFAVRSYTSPGQLKWRLNGKAWRTNKEGEKRIYLEELQAGAYQVEAYFESDLGVVSNAVSYAFHIQKPYWQQWWYYALIYLGIGAVLAAIVGGRWYDKRKEERLQGQNNLLRMQSLQAQMNPHFIFNIQTAIQGLWLKGNEADALALQNKFSKLLRKIFQYSGYLSISMDQLIEFLENYIDLEQIRFKNKVSIDLTIDPTLLEEDYLIPPLLVQPILENSFKHGLLHREGLTTLSIEFKKSTNYLYCIIEDNGVGRSTILDPLVQQSKRASGLKTTQARLALLQQSVIKSPHLYNNLRITDLKDADNKATGTRVELWIPFVSFQEAK